MVCKCQASRKKSRKSRKIVPCPGKKIKVVGRYGLLFIIKGNYKYIGNPVRFKRGGGGGGGKSQGTTLYETLLVHY